MDELGAYGMDWFLNQFAPDLMTAGQWADSRRADPQDRPLRNLYVAIVEDFLRQYAVPPKCPTEHHRKVFRWYERQWVEKPGPGPFCLDVCCEILDWNVDYVRQGMCAFMGRVDAGERVRFARRMPVANQTKVRAPTTKQRRIVPAVEAIRRKQIGSSRRRGSGVRLAVGA